MRCLVTGGAGFIGSHVLDALMEAGHSVRIFDTRRSTHHPGEDHRIGSILDLEALRQAMNGVCVVFHLAAVADVRDVFLDPMYAENVNVRGTINVLEAARQSDVEHVLFSSTSWVYSDARTEVVDEDTPIYSPMHLYTATKIAGEHYCHAYGALYGLPFTVLRYGIPYGPRQRPGTVIHAFVERILRGEPIEIHGDGLQYRQFVYVKDLASGNVAALRPSATGKTYNLDGPRKVSIKEVAMSVISAVGSGEIRYGQPRPGDFGGKTVLIGKAKAELGWGPVTSLDEGIAEFIEWYRGQGHDNP